MQSNLLKFSIALFLNTIAAIENGQKQQRHVSHIRNADGSSASKILSVVYLMLEIQEKQKQNLTIWLGVTTCNLQEIV